MKVGGQHKRILIVEDTVLSRELMKALLKHEGFDVIVASDGVEALKLIAAEAPDLIITDLQMPRLNGLQLITILRNRQEYNRVPIVALTSYGSVVADSALSAGADIALQKPVGFEDLTMGLIELLHIT